MTPTTMSSDASAPIVDLKREICSEKSTQTSIKYLKSLDSIRDRCRLVYEEVKKGTHPAVCFSLHEEKLSQVADFVASLIRRDYKNPKTDVPPHGRWRHFLPSGSVESQVIDKMKELGFNAEEIAKSTIDLFVISVLLDAGAGDKWKYQRGCEGGSAVSVGRSEGLAMASMDMFLNGIFSSNGKDLTVESDGLKRLTLQDLSVGLQVNPENNPLVGLEGRLELLHRLGSVLETSKYFEKNGTLRPGNLIYFLMENSIKSSAQDGKSIVGIEKLWEIVVEGFGGVWPAGRSKVQGVSIGDAWPTALLSAQKQTQTQTQTQTNNDNGDNLCTFHKLSQWLTYSIVEPIESILPIKFVGLNKMTGLAEYRNGGLFVDFGVIELKPEFSNERNEFKPDHEVIVQWRALTVYLLDRLAPILREKLSVSEEEFSLPKMLEGGTWKAGREIAKEKRPETAGPPINIISDGTVF